MKYNGYLKKSIFILLVIMTLCLCACNKENETPEFFNDEEYDEYKALYLGNSFIDDNANGIYSSKFTSQNQGENNWYCLYRSGKKLKELPFDNGCYSNGACYIKSDVMSSTKSKSAIRQFVATRDGEAAIIGNPISLKQDGTAKVNILLNGTVIYTNNIKDDDKIGDCHSVKVKLKREDKLQFVLIGNAIVNWCPYISYNNEVNSLYFDMPGHIGDVHPYYADGKMYMYYLSCDGTYTSNLLVSDDLINYKPVGLQFGSPKPVGEYFVLGVVKEDDLYRSYYGYSQSVINNSVSDDLITWKNGVTYNSRTQKEEHLPTIEYKNNKKYVEVRDPYIFYDSDINKYRIIYMAYYQKDNSKYDVELVIATSVGNTTKFWEKSNTVSHLRFNGEGKYHNEEPEVPQMMKIGDRWYTFAYMHNREGVANRGLSYWFGNKNEKIEDIDWNELQEHNLNGIDLVAPQVVNMKDKYYLYGWISHGGWGGTLSIAQEIYQKSDGSLGLRLDSYMSKQLNDGRLYGISKISCNDKVEIGNYDGNNLILGNLQFKDNATITFNGQKKVKVVFDKNDNTVNVIVNNVIIASTNVNYTNNTEFKMINESGFLDIYVNNESALTVNLGARDVSLTNANIIFESEDAFIKAIDICKLANPKTFHC